MKMTCIIILTAVFFNNKYLYAQRIGHASEAYKIIKTEHFDVVAPAKQQDLGLYYAAAAEKAYQKLNTVFKNKTAKIVLLVNDNTDIPNGYATRIPYPHIVAYSVPVSDHDSLSEAGDWPRELLTHELTHILQFEPATGFYSWLRPIFGNIIAPNMLTPTWWKEGMSVEMETQFTPRGRLRSTYQDATLRSLVLDKKLNDYPLPTANEVLPSWPYGSRAYLFGSLFFSQLNFDTHDIKSSSFLADRQGERAPYFLEYPMQELVDRSYEMEYVSALYHVEMNSQKQAAAITKKAVTELKNIEQKNESSFLPTYSITHKLLAFSENIEGTNSVSITDENNIKLNLKNLPSGEIISLDFHPTEKKILYTKNDRVNSKQIFSDLYVYDIELDKSEQLSYSQRARSAKYSENGKEAVFVTTFSGQTQIRTIDLKNKNIKFMINSGLGYRYESPLFWDETHILASKIDKDGLFSLVKIDITSKAESTMPLKQKQIRFLKKVNSKLFFISSENGVNNIYSSTDLAAAIPHTNLLTGAWSFTVSSDEKTAWASVMTSTGFKVTEVKLTDYDLLPKIENEIANRYNFTETASVPLKYTTSDYEAGSYLWPSYWIPFLSTSSSSKGLFIQAQTTGFDPLKSHFYSLAASYDSELKRGNFSGAYINSVYKVPFQISSQTQSRALGLATDIVQTTTHSISLLPDVFSINKNMLFELGAQLQKTYYVTNTEHWGPYAQVLYKNYEKNLYQISPESGWGTLLKLEKNYKLSDETGFIAQDYEKAHISFIGFTSLFLPKHHAIKTKLSSMLTFSSVYGRYGTSSSSSFIEEDGLIPQYVMRGYPSAQFFGRKIWNANFEYRFPISTIERGSGTDAYFFKQITGAVIADGIGVEGSGLTEQLTTQSLRLNESIWNSGLELKLETTVGYVLPMNFVLGFYLPHSPLYASGSQIGLALQIGGF